VTGFSVVLRGYDRQQVDELIAKVEGTLGRAPLHGDPLTLKRFQWVRFDVVARGYARFEVDAAMRGYRRELAAREGVELPPEEEPNVALSVLMGGDGGEESLASYARSVHDFPIRFRGYDRRQVDELMAGILATLGRPGPDGQPLSPENVNPPITRERLRAVELDIVLRGYDRRQVDDAVSRYLLELIEREG
jgi:DivIVA domain-containing protein